MMPSQLALAFRRLHLALTESRAASVLEPLRPYSGTPKPDVQALLRVFAALSSAQAQFGEVERSLLTAFGLLAVVDTAWWAALITACTRATMNDEAASMIEETHARLQIAIESFPALATLLDLPSGIEPPGPAGLAMLLPGLDGAPPTLTRVASAIEAVNQLWTVAEELTGNREPLCLMGTTPGPMMVLHFDGPSEPLAEMRALLASIGEQADRLPQMPVERHPALVSEMLPVMQRIGQSGRSDAMRLRSAVEGGVRRLLEAGCTLRPPLEAEAIGSAGPSGSPAKPAWGQPQAATGLGDDDAVRLATVIAEERSQLRQAELSRRMWQGAAAHPV